MQLLSVCHLCLAHTHTHTAYNRYERLRTEFEEFQENSQELEAELEASLEQTESKNRDLQAKLQRLEDENDSLKVSTLLIWTY